MKLLVSLVIWAAAVVGAAELSSAVAAHNKTAAGSGSSAASPPPPFNPSSVRSTDRLSLFRESNLARALAIGRTHLGAGARISDATLYPGYLLLAVAKSGAEGQSEIDASGAYSFTASPVSSNAPAFSLGALRAGTPAKLAGEIAAAGHVPESRLGYMILLISQPSGGPQWLVYPVRPGAVEYYVASATGRHLLAWTSNGPRPLR